MNPIFAAILKADSAPSSPGSDDAPSSPGADDAPAAPEAPSMPGKPFTPPTSHAPGAPSIKALAPMGKAPGYGQGQTESEEEIAGEDRPARNPKEHPNAVLTIKGVPSMVTGPPDIAGGMISGSANVEKSMSDNIVDPNAPFSFLHLMNQPPPRDRFSGMSEDELCEQMLKSGAPLEQGALRAAGRQIELERIQERGGLAKSQAIAAQQASMEGQRQIPIDQAQRMMATGALGGGAGMGAAGMGAPSAMQMAQIAMAAAQSGSDPMTLTKAFTQGYDPNQQQAAPPAQLSGNWSPEQVERMQKAMQQQYQMEAEIERRVQVRMAEMQKAMYSNMEGGEPTPGPSIGHESLSASGSASGGQDFNSDAKNGMPSPDAGTDQVWAEDDAEITSQLSSGQPSEKELASQMAGGAADLVSSVDQHYGNIPSGGEMPGIAKGYRAFETAHTASDIDRYYAIEQRRLEAARDYDFQWAPERVEKAMPATPPQALAMNTPHQQWLGAGGTMVFSDFEDRYIEKSQNEQGFIQEEPTLSIPGSPMTRNMTCGLCKSQHPRMFTTCPHCGHDHARPAQFGGTLLMEKSVADAIHPHADDDLHFPGGVMFIK